MRNFVGYITNRSMWGILLLVIAIYSAFAFYKAGYTKATTQHSQIITQQQEEINKLKNMLLIERQTYLSSTPFFMATAY